MNENSPNSNLNETDLLEFALRLATYHEAPDTQNARLLPGQLPDQLPVDIPVPDGSRILGSLIRSPESINMLLDTHLSPEQVLTFYRERMQVAGWQTNDMDRPRRGGFISSGSRSRGGTETFYQSLNDPALTVNDQESSSAWRDHSNRIRSGPALTVNAFVGKGNVTDVRLNLQLNSPLPPGPLPYMRSRPARSTFGLLPALEAPEGTQLTGHGGGGGQDNAYANAILETNIDLSTLAAHYKSELEQAGCVLTDEGQDGPLAWNTWTLKDEEKWNGFFIILNILDQEYYLTMRMKTNSNGGD